MSDWYAFALAALAVLFVPGPTNTLLATSGAAAGFRKSAKLVLAEMAGYAISITTQALLIGPIIRTSYMLSAGLRIGCAAYLIYAAWKLWREGAAAITSARPVPLQRLFVATLLNPKGVLFAFVIVPFLAQGQVMEALPYMAGLLVMIALAGSSWVAVGAAIRSGGSRILTGGIVRRAGAVVLCVFAVIISASVMSSPKPSPPAVAGDRPA